MKAQRTSLQGIAVAVTGAEGFIGSHLVESLCARGAKVRALVQYNSFSSLGWLDGLSCLPSLDVIFGDVRDAAQMRRFVQGNSIVLHLAALISVPYSYQAAESFVETNIRGTLNMLEAAKDAGVSRYIQTSTSEVYGTARYVPIDEAHPLQPQSPYAASKVGADALAQSYHLSHELPVVIARPFNTFGPRQSTRAVIPTIITQLASGQEVLNLGELSSTRDFSYVQDTVEGLLALASTPGIEGEVFNLGSNREISIAELATAIASIMGRQIRIDQQQERLRPEHSEVRRLFSLAQKAAAATGWRPTFSLEDGLRQTIAWFSKKENLGKYRSGVYFF